MRIVRSANAEVDVRLVDLGVSGRANGPHGLPFGDSVAHADGDRAQMCEGDGPAVVGPDREGPTVRRE
jgi:hypothetical protein